MPSLLNKPKGVSCRACGAVAGRPARYPETPQGVCGNCEARFRYWDQHGKRRGAVSFEMWLAHRLETELKRRLRTGISGPCEATAYTNLTGYQCGLPAVVVQDGRKICKVHARSATTVNFVDGSKPEPLRHIADCLHELGRKDQDFRQMILTVAGLLETGGELMDRFLETMSKPETEDEEAA